MREDLREQIVELTGIHKGLTSIVERAAETVLSGTLPFEASADGLETITDAFEIELTIPHEFPDTPPRVKEVGGRIGADYEHLNPDGTLCLAVPVEQRKVLFEEPSLLGFVNRLVIPFLYGYCYWRTHGYHPFDEAAHGYEGILRYYMDALGLSDEVAALAVISFLFEHGYRGHHSCPCGSDLKVRACHGPTLLALHQAHTEQTLRNDFLAILDLCYAKYQQEQLSFPKPLRRQLGRLLKRFRS